MIDNNLDGENYPSIVQKYHSQIFEMVNSRLTETSKFYVPLIALISGFGSLIIPFIQSSKPANYLELVQFAYRLSMVLIFCGIFYLLTVSYTYRTLQVVLARLENALQLAIFAPNWDPCRAVILRKNTSFLCESLSKTLKRWLEPEALNRPIPRFIFLLCKVFSLWIFPEILKAHLLILLSTAAMVSYLNVYVFGQDFKSFIVFSGSLFLASVGLNLHYLYKVRSHCIRCKSKKNKEVEIGTLSG